MSKDKIPQHVHDVGYRKIFSFVEMVKHLVEGYVDEDWKDQLDLPNGKRVDGTFVLEDFEKLETDILYEIPFADKKDNAYVYILIENQSKIDHTMPFRLLVYLTRVWKRVFDNTDKNERKNKSFRFPPVFPIVLYNGSVKWSAKTSMREIVDKSDLFGDYIPNIKYHLVDIGRLDLEKIEEIGNTLSTIFVLERDLTAEEFDSRYKKALSYLEKEENSELWKSIAQWICMYLKRKHPENKDLIEEIDFSKSREEVKPMLETMPDKLVAYGEEKGRKEAKKQSIIAFLEARFGKVTETIETKVGGIEDIQKLDAMIQKAARADSLDDFEKVL